MWTPYKCIRHTDSIGLDKAFPSVHDTETHGDGLGSHLCDICGVPYLQVSCGPGMRARSKRSWKDDCVVDVDRNCTWFKGIQILRLYYQQSKYKYFSDYISE